MGLLIGWSKVDTEAKGNSNPTIADKQSFSDVSLLKIDENLLTTIDYATVGELNQSLLDNSQPVMLTSPSSVNIVVWSNSISDYQGYFAINPKLIVTFTDVVTSSGITLYFWKHNNEYCREVIIRWYDANLALIDTKTFYPDNWEYFCSNYIEQYKKIEVEYVRTTLPRRYLKLTGIQYGERINLDESQIVTARLVESIGLTSSQLFTNQLECDIISLENNFNIITNPGILRGIQINQKVKVKDNEEDIGTYFIQKSTVEGNIINLFAYDLIGYLETREFKGGLYENVTFEYIINQIKTQAGLSNVFSGEHTGFDIPTSIANTVVSGYIPYTNCREALHQLCYATNVVANCIRGEKIKIFKLSDIITSDNVDETKLIMDTLAIENNELFTSISLNAFSYKEEVEQKELENKYYNVGTHTIRFTKPYNNYTISGGTIISYGNNFITFKVTVAGTVIIQGYGYEEITQQFTANDANYMGDTPSIKEMTDVRMVSTSLAQDVADTQLSLYLLKYKLSADVYDLDADIGDYVDIGDASGYIQYKETDLIAKDVCRVEVLGNATVNN